VGAKAFAFHYGNDNGTDDYVGSWAATIPLPTALKGNSAYSTIGIRGVAVGCPNLMVSFLKALEH
jgi:hypothetical protein